MGTQGGNLPDSLLLRLNRNERAVSAHLEAKGYIPAEEAPPGLLVGLRLSDTLPDAVALGLGKCCGESLDVQRRQIEGYAHMHGLTLAEVV